MKLIDQHIISEFFQVLLLGTFAILGIFFGTVEFKNMLQLLSQFDVPVLGVLSIWVLQIPTGALYALPAGMLVSTMIVLMRKHRDSEMVALRTLGVSRWRLARPFIIVGVLCSTISFMVGEFMAPQAKHLSTKLLLLEACKSARPYPQLNKIELPDADNKLSQLMIMGKTAGRTINGFLLFNFADNGVVRLTWSEFAERVRGNWELRNGHLFELFSEDKSANKGAFGSMKIPTVSQLWNRIDEPFSPLERTTEQLRKQIDRLEKQNKPVPGELLVQLNRRYSQPLSCLLLVMAALPIAFLNTRRDIRLPLAYGALMVPGYFLMQQIFLSLGENGGIDPFLAAWVPSMMLCLVAVLFGIATRKWCA